MEPPILETPDEHDAFIADDKQYISYQADTVIKVDPENRIATSILDKDIKRWK